MFIKKIKLQKLFSSILLQIAISRNQKHDDAGDGDSLGALSEI